MRVLVLFVCALTLGLASVATANIPDLSTSTAETAFHAGGGTGAVTLYVVPDGTGSVFADAKDATFAAADATVTLYLRNSVGGGIANFPAEDLELRSAGLALCGGIAIAEAATDANGMTVWSTALNAGGNTAGLAQVFVAGDALTSAAGMELYFNSADINGDLSVDLIDVGNFSTDMNGTYDTRSDFVFDGVINLSDVGKLASAMGAACQ